MEAHLSVLAARMTRALRPSSRALCPGSSVLLSHGQKTTTKNTKM
jgi:hypothetical protein